VRLEVFGARKASQVRDQFLLVARREERRDQDDVGDPSIDGSDCRLV
jgi:hypothetical protein